MTAPGAVHAGDASAVLGAVPLVLGGPFGMESSDVSADRLERFVDHGGTAVETASSYARGAGLRAVGAWTAAHPGRVDVVVKIGHDRTGGDMELSRENVLRDVDEALQVLHVDALAVMMLHSDDVSRPVAEIADTLVALVDDGKARAVGASNWTAPRLAELAERLVTRGHVPLTSYHLSLAEPVSALLPGTALAADSDVLEVVRGHDLPLLSWTANAGGYFARDDDASTDRPDAFDTPKSRARRARCRELAARLGTQPAVVALAGLLAQPRTWASVGPSSPAHLAEAFEAAALELSDVDVAWLRDGT